VESLARVLADLLGERLPPELRQKAILGPCERCPAMLTRGLLWLHLEEYHRLPRWIAIAAARRVAV